MSWSKFLFCILDFLFWECRILKILIQKSSILECIGMWVGAHIPVFNTPILSDNKIKYIDFGGGSTTFYEDENDYATLIKTIISIRFYPYLNQSIQKMLSFAPKKDQQNYYDITRSDNLWRTNNYWLKTYKKKGKVFSLDTAILIFRTLKSNLFCEDLTEYQELFVKKWI